MLLFAIGDPLPDDLLDKEVHTLEGRLPLRALLDTSRANLVVFLRHFGCIGCSMNLTELGPRFTELDRLGIQTVLIGNGSAQFLEPFIAHFNLDKAPVRVATDTSEGLESYAAAGMIRSFWRTVGPRSALDFARGLANGHTNRIKGDWWQMGGAIFIDVDARVRLVHRAISLGGHTSSVALVDEALRLYARRGLAAMEER